MRKGSSGQLPVTLTLKQPQKALNSRGYHDPFPFDRTSVVYCHPVVSVAEELHEIGGELGDDDVIVVVDLKMVSAPLYLADMSAASEFVEYQVAPEIAPMTDTFTEAIRQYEESIVHLGRTETVPEHELYENCELVVDGDVPTDAIVDFRG